MRRLGIADDFGDADGQDVLSFGQAQSKARTFFDRARMDTGEEARQRGPFKVSDAWALYREDCVRREVKALERLDCAWRLYIEPEFGGMEVERLTQSRIEHWLTAIAEKAPRRRARKFGTKPAEGPKPKEPDAKRKRRASANRVLTVLKTMLTHARRKQKVSCPMDAWATVKPFPEADQARTRFLSLEEQARLVNACDPNFRRLVQAGLFTGARFQELARIKAKDFDRGNGSVWIAPGKSGKGRHVVLTEEAGAFFQEATAGLGPDAPVFTHLAFDGREWKAARVQRAWKRSEQQRPMQAACKGAGLEPMGFHQLRHSYASALVNAHLPLAFVAAQLGHSDTRMVEKHYGHLAPSALKDAIRKLAPMLGIFTPGKVEGLKIKR